MGKADGGVVARKSALLSTLFPAGVTAAEFRSGGPAPYLPPEEVACVANSSARRRADFAAGRDCARLALQQIGHENSILLANPDRSPHWPAGTVGSISHTTGFAGAVAARTTQFQSLGLDVERFFVCDDSMSREVLTQEETAWLALQPQVQQTALAALLFCAKEAFYKCQYPVTRRWLEFTDVSLRAASGMLKVVSAPDGISGLNWSGRYLFDADLICAGFFLRNEG